MTVQNPVQEAESSDNTWSHFFNQDLKKDNSYMMKGLLCLRKNTEISTYKNSSIYLCEHTERSCIFCRWKCS